MRLQLERLCVDYGSFPPFVSPSLSCFLASLSPWPSCRNNQTCSLRQPRSTLDLTPRSNCTSRGHFCLAFGTSMLQVHKAAVSQTPLFSSLPLSPKNQKGRLEGISCFSVGIYFLPLKRRPFFLSQFVFFSLIIAGKLTVFYNQVFNFRPWENLLRHKECLVLGWLWGGGGRYFYDFCLHTQTSPSFPFPSSTVHGKLVALEMGVWTESIAREKSVCSRQAVSPSRSAWKMFPWPSLTVEVSKDLPSLSDLQTCLRLETSCSYIPQAFLVQ